MRPASQRFFIHSCIYILIMIISYLETFLGTNSLSVLMCCKAVDQSALRALSNSMRQALPWQLAVRGVYINFGMLKLIIRMTKALWACSVDNLELAVFSSLFFFSRALSTAEPAIASDPSMNRLFRSVNWKPPKASWKLQFSWRFTLEVISHCLVESESEFCSFYVNHSNVIRLDIIIFNIIDFSFY